LKRGAGEEEKAEDVVVDAEVHARGGEEEEDGGDEERVEGEVAGHFAFDAAEEGVLDGEWKWRMREFERDGAARAARVRM